MKDRLFSCLMPAGVSYSDKSREVGGDYKKLAFLPYDTLVLEVQKDCPIELEEQIRRDARTVQCQVGQQYRVSETGQTVLLGSKIKPVKMTIRSQSASEVHEIIAFSMCEPAVMAARFKTRDGRYLRTEGCVLSFDGDVNALPPAMN